MEFHSGTQLVDHNNESLAPVFLFCIYILLLSKVVRSNVPAVRKQTEVYITL
jgi:hypothetical protein